MPMFHCVFDLNEKFLSLNNGLGVRLRCYGQQIGSAFSSHSLIKEKYLDYYWSVTWYLIQSTGMVISKKHNIKEHIDSSYFHLKKIFIKTGPSFLFIDLLACSILLISLYEFPSLIGNLPFLKTVTKHDREKLFFLLGPFPPPLKASWKPHIFTFKDTNSNYIVIPWTDFYSRI